ncbi:MAG: HNH endonuclease [Betaproteobacteria bacterium]|nr:HNH endonuclease [Betaproteobacteria bacterium]
MNDVAIQIAQLEFLTKLQRILGEGLFSASYKYALLLSLAELSVEQSIPSDGTLRIELDELAGRFITLYWRQVAPFKGRLLAQNAGRQASIISKISAFKSVAPTLAVARSRTQWPRLVHEVGRLLVEMPLWKLQRVGEERLDFLYEERLTDRSIVLRPGVAACFRAQFGVVQALVQSAWLSFVQRLPPNRPILGSMTDLADFLFGAERSGLRVIADGLLGLQKGGCFYCGGRVRDGGDVDHFIPWSRYPLDLGHNFVLAHASCNQDKRDMLAAAGHLQRWIERNDSQAGVLDEVFNAARFPFDADASSSVAEWAYENAERAGALVWVRRNGQTSRLTAEWREYLK